MAVLKNTTHFEDKSEWAYLFAIADVYEKYSGPKYGKSKDDFPHPLKDYEILKILSKDYGISAMHLNTLANYRTKLEKYFGFKFRSNKKGKYIVNSFVDFDLDSITRLILVHATQKKLIGKIDTTDYSNLYNNIKNELENEILNKNIQEEEKEYNTEKDILNTALIALNNHLDVELKTTEYSEPLVVKIDRIYLDKNNEIRIRSTGELKNYNFLLKQIKEIRLIKEK